MKKIFSASVVLLAAVTLAACSNNHSSVTSKSSESKAASSSVKKSSKSSSKESNSSSSSTSSSANLETPDFVLVTDEEIAPTEVRDPFLQSVKEKRDKLVNVLKMSYLFVSNMPKKQ